EKDELVYSGTLLGADGTFSGTLSGGTITGSTIYGTEFLSSNWDGNTYGTWFNELTINGGEIRLGRTRYNQDGTTHESRTSIYSGVVATQQVNTFMLGSSSNRVDNGYFKNINASEEVRTKDLYIDGSSTKFVPFKATDVSALYSPD